MFFTEIEKFNDLIQELPKEKIQEMEVLYQKIISLNQYGEDHWAKFENNTLMVLWASVANEILEFWEFFYRNQMIVKFDWSEWKKSDYLKKGEKIDLSHFTILELCQLLTTISRADRFVEGFMLSKFETGQAQEIIYALIQKLKQQHNIL